MAKMSLTISGTVPGPGMVFTTSDPTAASQNHQFLSLILPTSSCMLLSGKCVCLGYTAWHNPLQCNIQPQPRVGTGFCGLVCVEMKHFTQQASTHKTWSHWASHIKTSEQASVKTTNTHTAACTARLGIVCW